MRSSSARKNAKKKEYSLRHAKMRARKKTNVPSEAPEVINQQSYFHQLSLVHPNAQDNSDR
jgi:hypothetical protein